MESGFVSLRPLYQFIADHPTKAGLEPGTPERRLYRAAASQLCSVIPQAQGFYLWGAYSPRGLWHNLYLGKAGFGRTSHLRARILEELHDEAACLWVTIASEQEFLDGGPDRYRRHMVRALRKQGATHIVWATDPRLSNTIVTAIESDLIETMSPRVNAARPVPPPCPQEHTPEVVSHFRSQIHLARGTRYLPAQMRPHPRRGRVLSSAE